MNPIVFALRRPYTVMVGVVAVVVAAVLAGYRSKVDVFPSLNTPVIYVCQPYGGMNPQQMEGLLTTYFEYHFLYVNGIEHVESKNIQGMALIKLYFHPGTDMGEAMAETVGAVNRARFMMPPGTVPPFVTRLDTGSASIGYLVLNSDKLSIKEIQDIATMRVRPMFANVPGISTPPAFGGNQRAVVVTVNPDKLNSQDLSLDRITRAVADGNPVAPSGNIRLGDRIFLVNTNAMVGANPIEELGRIPVRGGPSPLFLKDVATITDGSDITAGYAHVNGRRSVYMLVTKRSDASTISVVNELNKAMPKMRDAAPEVDIQFAFDQSPIVKEAMWGVGVEGAIGAALTGLMVLLFLRDWRSVLVVVLNIPLALMAALFGLWVCGQTVNLMTLGGLALSVGILVDEATVEVENIHTQMGKTDSLARAVRAGNQETAVPRLLAMLCVLSVFVPSFFMSGAARELFVPLSLAVGFAMIASYLLSSTFVPVLCVWLLKPIKHADHGSSRLQRAYERIVARAIAARWALVPVFLLLGVAAAAFFFTQLGTAIFPPTDKGVFLLRMKAPTGTRIERTEELAHKALAVIEREAGGPEKVRMSVGYVGSFPTNYPIQAVHQWSSGPEEVQLKVALSHNAGLRTEPFKAKLREILDHELKDWLRVKWEADGVPPEEREKRAEGLRLSFEPGDLVNEVMSFGSPTPVEVQVSGNAMADTLKHANALLPKLRAVPQLKDVQLTQSQDYPTVNISIDRERAAVSGLTARNVSDALIPATASSRYMNPIYWMDPKSGQGYIVQVQLPPPDMSLDKVRQVPVAGAIGVPVTTAAVAGGAMLLGDVADVTTAATPGEVDRYNMRRFVSITANVDTADLGQVRRAVLAAVADAGAPPKGVNVDVRGQLEALDQVQRNLLVGLGVAVLAILLLLTAYFQSIRLALTAVAGVPATLAGVGLMLWTTSTTLNLQSFMGGIMAVGVSVANAILLVTFAERSRITHGNAVRAALDGGAGRVRPILMTSLAMIAGMVPMAIGFGEGGDQTAPLGRAVIGGLAASTLTTLFVLPAVFAVVQRKTALATASLDPDDPNSTRYDVGVVSLFPT
ncbi:MAG: efflux RND transporter permease subunit [Fimbriiglobus sp.]|nr:efflux RND transporter permease subunit [Fimbriiglobus sp.]